MTNSATASDGIGGPAAIDNPPGSRVRRYDRNPIRRKARRDEKTGFLHVDGTLTKAPAVFPYRQPDGTILREFRPADHVMSRRNLDSISGAVVTNDHPSVRVTARNVRRFQVGHGGSSPHVDADKLDSSLVVTDTDTIDDMKSGKLDISLGYDCDLVMQSGVYTDDAGQRHPYDAIQKNHETNHIAIVKEGRAGPDCRAHLDRTDAVQVDPQGATQMPTELKLDDVVKREDFLSLLGGDKDKARVKVDGIDIELPTSQAQAVADALATRDNSIASEKKRADVADAAKDAAVKERDDLKADADPTKIRARVQARIALEDKASPHFDEKEWANAQKLDDGELRKAVVTKVHDGIDLADKSDDYIAAAFDLVPAPKGDDTKNLRRLGTAVLGAKTDDEASEHHDAIEKSINAQIEADDNAWRNPVPGGFTADGKTPMKRTGTEGN